MFAARPSPDISKIADALIREAAEIRAYQDFCNDFSMCQHVFIQVQDCPEDEDLIARLITGPAHTQSFRPQLWALMQTHNTAHLSPEQLRGLYR